MLKSPSRKSFLTHVSSGVLKEIATVSLRLDLRYKLRHLSSNSSKIELSELCYLLIFFCSAVLLCCKMHFICFSELNNKYGMRKI